MTIFSSFLRYWILQGPIPDFPNDFIWAFPVAMINDDQLCVFGNNKKKTKKKHKPSSDITTSQSCHSNILNRSLRKFSKYIFHLPLES